MSDYECEKCNKIFQSKYSLNRHLKSSKSCGNDSLSCSYCGKLFTTGGTLKYHVINACDKKKEKDKDEENSKTNELKKDLLLKEEIIKNFEKKIEDQDKYYDRLIVNETISKEKLRNEARVKETMYEKQIQDLKKTIEDLHTKIEKLVATKSSSTVNNIINNSGNMNLNTFITPEFVRAQTANHLTYDHFANGVKGLANFVHDFVLMDKNGKLVYACYDKARHVLRYKDEQDNEIDDIDAEKLIGIVERPIKDKYFKICKDLQGDIDRYQRILDDEDEFQSMKKDAKEKKEKCERCLKVMEFQSNVVCTIGMSKNKEFSRAIEKRCLAPKVRKTKTGALGVGIESLHETPKDLTSSASTSPSQGSVEVIEEQEEEKSVDSGISIGEKFEKYKQKIQEEETIRAKEAAKKQAEYEEKFAPYKKFKGFVLHKETSLVFDRDKKVVGKSVMDEEDGGEVFVELEEDDIEMCKKLNFVIGEDEN